VEQTLEPMELLTRVPVVVVVTMNQAETEDRV
jgi:hypothetical protein